MTGSFDWTSASIMVGALSLLGILIRQIGPWRKQEHEAAAIFRDTLLRRIERLEDKLERQEARHGAEKRLLTHKLRNITADFDAILMLLEMNPDRGPEIIAKIQEQRARHMVAEAKEAAIISANAMEAVVVSEADHDGN